MDILEVKARLKESRQLLSRYGVSAIYVFGSVAKGTATAASDIDFIVDFQKPITLLGLIRFRSELSDLFGRRVDVVTEDALHPALAKGILEERVRAA